MNDHLGIFETLDISAEGGEGVIRRGKGGVSFIIGVWASMGPRRPLALALTSALVLLATVAMSEPAAAQERIAVLGFGGPRGPSARAAVARVMGEQYEVIATDEWREAAESLGVSGRSADVIAQVAGQLGLKAVVTGGLRRARRRWTLSVIVRDGADGHVVGRRSAAIPSPSRAGAAGASLARALLDVVAEARGASGGGATAPQETTTASGGSTASEYDFSDIENERPPALGGRVQQAEDDEGPPGHRRRRRRRSSSSESDSGESSSGDEFDEAFAEEEDGGHHEANPAPQGYLQFSVEVNATSRNFSVPIDPACDSARSNPRDEAALNTKLYSEFGFRAWFYPGATVSDRWFAHIGIEGGFHHHLYLRIVDATRTNAIETSEYSVDVGLVIRIPIATASREITLYFRGGWHRYSFFMGDQYNDIIPPFTYDGIALGIGLNIPLYSNRFGLELGGSYVGVLSLGPYVTEAYNMPGEVPSATGVLANIGFSGDLYRGLRWRVLFELEGYFSSHTGKGHGWGSSDGVSTLCEQGEACREDLTSCWNSNGEPVAGGIRTTGGATDLIWRLGAQISYRFGWRPEATGRRRSEADRDEHGDEEEGAGESEETEEDDEEWQW